MPGKILGLHIDEDAVSAVVVRSGFREARIVACGRVAFGETGLEGAVDALAEGIDLRNDAAVVSIPSGKAALHTLSMPFSDPRKIRQALPYEMESLIPFPVDSRVTDFIKCDAGLEPNILAASISPETISEVLACLGARGIDAQAIDLDYVPTVAWLLRCDQVPDDGIFLHIGIKRHSMVLFVRRRVVLIRSFNGGGEHENPVADLLGVEGGEIQDPGKLRLRAEEMLESLSRQVIATIHAHSETSELRAEITRVYFSGPGGLLPEAGSLLYRFTGFTAEAVNVASDRAVRMDKPVADIWNPFLMNGALALALRDPKGGNCYDFRRGNFEIKTPLLGSFGRLKAAGFMTALFVILWIAHSSLEYKRLQSRYDALGAGMEQIFRQIFPDVTRIVDPLQQMKVMVAGESGSRGTMPGIGTDAEVLALIRDLSERIPDDLNVRISVLIIDQETVRLSGRTSDFNMVDGIKNSLDPSTYFSGVTITSANIDRTGRHVQFELRLQRARGGAA